MTLPRRILLAIVLLLCLVTAADARRRKRRSQRAKKVLENASGPVLVKLESVDVNAGRGVVLVGGVAREPGARLFTFHDDKDRHFIALDASCVAAGPSTMRCTLALPRPYLRGHIVAMTAHLKGREVEADGAEVERIFNAARAVPAGRPAEGGSPDGGVLLPPTDGGVATHTSSSPQFEAPAWHPLPAAPDGGWSHEEVGEDTEEWHELREQETEKEN